MILSLSQKCVLRWMRNDPRWWSPADIAAGLNSTPMHACAIVAPLIDAGEVERERRKGRAYYRIAKGAKQCAQ